MSLFCRELDSLVVSDLDSCLPGGRVCVLCMCACVCVGGWGVGVGGIFIIVII